jgi:hypothetical protein
MCAVAPVSGEQLNELNAANELGENNLVDMQIFGNLSKHVNQKQMNKQDHHRHRCRQLKIRSAPRVCMLLPPSAPRNTH